MKEGYLSLSLQDLIPHARKERSTHTWSCCEVQVIVCKMFPLTALQKLTIAGTLLRMVKNMSMHFRSQKAVSYYSSGQWQNVRMMLTSQNGQRSGLATVLSQQQGSSWLRGSLATWEFCSHDLPSKSNNISLIGDSKTAPGWMVYDGLLTCPWCIPPTLMTGDTVPWHNVKNKWWVTENESKSRGRHFLSGLMEICVPISILTKSNRLLFF